ncbi:MAG: serine/threonine protein kinase, partial [Gemmatimonadota bacterium]|nr:serine/threonine protein kinase [Gemmatimonadota bacterium]
MTDTAGRGAPCGAAPSPERWPELQHIIDPALELPSEERTNYVARACAGDALLREEVERFLRSCDEALGWLEGSAPQLAAFLLETAHAETVGPSEGTFMGPYRLVREVGRGGMGAVYLAERDDAQYRKRVAIKIVRDGVWLGGDDHLVRRFVEERQILASLDHPNIARLLDGGVTDGGLPWFAMEYVEGAPIDRYCDDRALNIDERLALFCGVCDAVAFAHRNLVVHRDLKPSN